MENLEQLITHQLQLQLISIKNSRLYPYMDWPVLQRLVTDQLVPRITDIFSDVIEQKEKENSQLRAKLNQLSFANNPERDNKIIELYNHGMSKRQISKVVGMTPWGVSKALRRLGINSG